METFQKEYRGNVVVITVNLVSATLNDTNEFKGFMNELILMTECDVVVNLATCSHLDSTFIGALVMNYKKLKQKNRNMVLVEPNDQTKVFLTMNSLSKIFPLYPSVEVAVEDLLNRNMLEKNLTNQNHNFVLSEQNDEIEDDTGSNADLETNTLASTETEAKINGESEDLQSVVEEEENISAVPELNNTYSNQVEDINETGELLEEKTDHDISKMNESYEQDRVSEENLLEEEMAQADINSMQSEKIVPENRQEQLVEEQDDSERDYREGNLAWDFGN